jgi:hypothetical protein
VACGILIAALVLTLIGPISQVRAQTTAFDPTNAQRATVLVMQTYMNAKGEAVIACTGSGTLVSADGLILTNAHIALPSDHCHSDRVVISLNARLGEPPIPSYYASVVEANRGYDLAVLRITATLDGHPILKGSLALPFVEMGDSDSVNLDDTLRVVGFSPIDNTSNGASQVAPAQVGGLTEEAQISTRLGSRASKTLGSPAWMMVSGSIPGSMSGGGAYSSDGKLVGIPTIEPALVSGAVRDCRRIQDSNGDGVIDDKDTCVPVGGTINALRPARLAQGLVLAANLGVLPDSRDIGKSGTLSLSGATPHISRMFLSTGVNQFGMPVNVVGSAPAGAKSLYLFFDYDGMVDGMIYELNVVVNGVPNAIYSLAPATWSGGSQGLWYIGSSAQVFQNGNYDFTLFVQGTRVASTKFTIGGGAKPRPTFSDILFGVPGPKNALINSGAVLPISNVLNASFTYANLPDKQPWCQIWYSNGKATPPLDGTPFAAANGTQTVSIKSSDGGPFPPGSYRLELYLSACSDPSPQLAATSDFVMGGNALPTGTQIFDTLNFYGSWKNDAPNGTASLTFSRPIPLLAATFNWHALGAGTPWTWRWSVDDRPLFEVTTRWDGDPEGTLYWLRLVTDGILPDGSYKLEVLTANTVMLTNTVKVGLGRLPVSIFGTAQGVQVEGQIRDAETGKTISGASFIVLNADVATRDFIWLDSQIFDISYADSDGHFALSKLLPRDKTYAVIVIASGYLPVYLDGLKIDAKTRSPLEYTVELNRD